MDYRELTDFEVMWDLWSYNAQKTPDKDAIVHWVAGEEPFRWTFKELIVTAEKVAYQLYLKGIRKDEVCALIIKHNKYFYPIYMAISRLGAIPAVLAYPNSRLHPEKFRQGIEGMSLRSGLDWILTERSIEAIISPLIDQSETSIKGIQFPLEWNWIEPSSDFKTYLNDIRSLINKNSPFLLQHSSGTTGLQKPVLLSHNAVILHVKNYSDSINLNKRDKVISWLPLYHDMGLIAAYHLPLAYGVTQVQIDTFEWIIIPSLLIEAAYKEKGTICWLPNFAYNLMADKIADEDIKDFSLETMRMIINCSEPVRNESHDKFYKHFSKFGLKRNVLSTCYAMAETTFAVSQSLPYKEIPTVKADRQELANGRLKIIDNQNNCRVCVSSGEIIKDCIIKIVGENNNQIPEGMVGEIVIHSVSMFEGYRNYPEKTAEALKEGWYYSGDFGFVYEDNLYVIGRKKDLIISAGNNIFPEDIEDQINKVEGVLPGRVVAFGEYDADIGSETISVIAETIISHIPDQKILKSIIVKQAMQMDITIKKVYLVPPRWLIKSSAGKPSRKTNKERIQDNKEFVWN